MTGRILIAGGSHADIPMILAAKKNGYTVFTSGNRPQELGHRYGDAYYEADYSDGEQIRALAARLKVDAICPSCNDFSAISCAFAAQELGLPGHDALETALTLHHKDRYRAFARAHGIRTPLAMSFDRPEDALACLDEFKLPAMVKPVDLTGGKGISKVERREEAAAAVGKAFAISRQRRIVVEEFVSGTRHAISAFLQRGKVTFSFTDNEVYFLNPYLVSGAYAPGSVTEAEEQELRRSIEEIARLLALADGIMHVQLIMSSDGPVIIEVCRRPPGDLYVKLVQHSTDIDYPSWIVRAFAGDSSNHLVETANRRPVLRHCIMSDRAGKVGGVYVDPSIRSKVIDQLLWHEGAQIGDPLIDKVGIMFLGFDTPEELAAKSEIMSSLIYPLVT